MEKQASVSKKEPSFRLNYRRTFIIGFAFFGILLLWQVYDSWCPTFLTELFASSIYGIPSADLNLPENANLRLDVQYLVGIVMAIDNLAALIMLPIFGRLSDKTHTKIGKRMPFILIGTFVTALVFPFIPVFFHFHMLAGVIVTMAIVLFFMMMYRSPAVALMPDITPKPLRSKANGIINIMGYLGGACATFLGLGFVLSDYLGTKSADSWAYQNIWAIETPFLVASVLMIASCLFLFFKIKENKLGEELRPELERGEKEAAIEDVVTDEDNKPISKKNLVMLILILAAEVCWFMSDNALSTYMGNWTMYYLGSSSSSVMILTIVGGVASVLGFWLGGVVADRIGRKWTIFGGLSLYLIGVFIMCFVVPGPEIEEGGYRVFPWLLYLVWVIKGFGIALVNTCSFPMVVELCSRKDVGKYTGYYYAASMGAQTVTPILIGLIFKFTKQWWILPIYCTSFIAVSLIIFFFVKNVKGKKTENKKGLEALGSDD